MSAAAGIAVGTFGRVALLDVDRPVHRHAHPHTHVLFKVAGRDTRFRVAGREVPLDGECGVVVNAWEPHDFPQATAGGSSLVLALYVEPRWLAEVDRGFAVSADPRLFPRASVRIDPRLGRALRGLCEQLVVGDPREREERLARVMAALLDRHSDWRALWSSRRPPAPCVRDFRLRRAMAFLSEARGGGSSVDAAAVGGLSRSGLFALFRSQLGLTPLLFRQALRMEACYRELTSDAAPLAEVAARLGFAAPPHLTRFFRDHLGVTPSAFRRALAAGRAARDAGRASPPRSLPR